MYFCYICRLSSDQKIDDSNRGCAGTLDRLFLCVCHQAV